MFLRPHRPHTNHDTEKPCWMEILQSALDGIIPSEQRLEAFLDRYERMP